MRGGIPLSSPREGSPSLLSREAEMERCEKDRSCSTCEEAKRCTEEEKRAHEEERLKRQLGRIRHAMMVISGKGGVGKTTIAVNIAAALAKEGHEVGLLDADIHGPNVPKMFGLDWRPLIGGEDGIKPVDVFPNLRLISMAFLLPNPDSPVVWRGPLKHTAIRQFLTEVDWGNLDFLIVDLPPGTGDEPLSAAQLIKERMDGSVVVTTPQDVALLDARKAVNFSRMLKVPVLGVVENMSGLRCPHCGELIPLFKTGGGERAAGELGVPFLGRVPIDPEIVQKGDSGPPYVLSEPDSDAARALKEIARRCKELMEKGGERR